VRRCNASARVMRHSITLRSFRCSRV